MFIPDMPNVPPQDAPVMIAQANQAQQGDVTTTRTLGVCHAAPNNHYSAENGIGPVASADFYLEQYEHRKVDYNHPSGVVTVLQQPKHGVLRLLTEADRGTFFDSSAGSIDPADPGYLYLPELGYEGKDSATLLVETGGVKVKVKYFFQAISGVLGNDGVDKYCGSKGMFWKISTTLDPNGNSTITSVEYQSPLTSAADTALTDTASLASILGLNFMTGANALGNSTADPSGITLNLADLPGGAIGQTTGTNITLDTNAAGYNWFIDPTPADNSEYLPTSNPNEWVAKAGSEAAGKMDMLSVLLHEYGHALGINHSADPNDYMGTTLTAGVRRLPSADELALMQNLIAQAKDGLASSNTQDNAPAPFPTLPLSGLGLSFIGFLRSSRYGGVNIVPDPSTLVTQYDWAANVTLTNGSLNAADGWSIQGGVDIGSSTGSGRTDGGATLYEVSGSQTRLSQVFMLSDKDRYLSFTLSGTALDNLTGAPDDAFEVALLNANTGASVLGSDGLTRTDAFLNLQADGTERMAQGVTRINNPDGSRTYRVDLSGVAKNTAVNLSFDLIGFGQNGSHVTVRDVRLSGLPQLHDDVASLAEDNLLSFNPFAQADSQLVPSLASHVVDAPVHGALAMNTDGTFSYTPDLNYFGTDRFSYRLSDGSPSTGQPCLTIKYGIGINAVA